MKIYHTETQADYDALMIELEEQGRKWASGRKPTESKDWVDHKEKTGVVIEKRITRACIGKLKFDYPDVPIQKYKAKADEKMKFTKENVYKMVERYNVDHGYLLGDLKSDISKLDDTPEKVVVPKFVADYLEDCKKRNIKLVSALCPFKMGYGKEIELWFDNEDNNRLFALAWINGYEVEKEPLYCVNINGQYLVKMIPERNVHKFVEEEKLCVWDTQAYQLTEAEIKKIDERYIPFMVPVDGANKD